MSHEIASKFWVNKYIYLFPLIGILAYKLLFSQVFASDSESSGGNVFNQLIIGSLIGLALFSLFQNKENVFDAIKANLVMILFLLYALFSCFWSMSPSISFKRWFQFFGFFVIGLSAVCGSKDITPQLKVFLAITALSQIFSLLFVILFPSTMTIGFGGWKGLFLHKNQLGSVCVISLAFWIAASNKSFPKIIRTSMPLVILIILILVVGSRSTTAVVICFSIFSIFCFLKFPIPMPIKAFFLPIPIILILLFLVNYTSRSPVDFVFAEILNKGTDFSGRTDLWQAIITSANENPILGVGYDAFWGTYRSAGVLIKHDISWINLNQSHNGYLDVFNELGIVGLVLFCTLLLSTITKLVRLLNKNIHLYISFLLILMSIVINNFTESSFCRQSNLNWIIFVVITVIVAHESHKKENGCSVK